MNIGKPFVDAWNIYLKNFGTIIISLIIVIILSVVTLGILSLPLFIGFQMLFVKAMRKKKIVANEVLDPIKRFFSLVSGYFAIGLLILFGCLLLLVPGLAWASWWMYGLLFIYDKNMHIEDGMRSSKELVRKNGTWWHLLFLAVMAFINIAAGQVLLALHIPIWIYYILSTLFIMPITSGALACAYADESK
ncbi:MAG: hypothetical protein KJ732_02535 [Candidatus Margulisbacteria bacterium]|nr:hypothetical protein [Candidatus Margulisiibacteriota bacterium]